MGTGDIAENLERSGAVPWIMDALINLVCPYLLPVSWQKPEFGPALVTLIVYFLACVKFRPQPPRLDQCNACEYPRTGLDAAAVCPECGSKTSPQQPPMTGFELRPGWRMNLPLSIGLFWLDIVLIRVAVLISYLLDHFSASTALVAMHRRELLELSHNSVLLFYALSLFNPACLVLAGPVLANRLMIAKTLLVGIVAMLMFSAPVGYY